MKVSELIEKLQRCDPEALVYATYEGVTRDIVVERTTQDWDDADVPAGTILLNTEYDPLMFSSYRRKYGGVEV